MNNRNNNINNNISDINKNIDILIDSFNKYKEETQYLKYKLDNLEDELKKKNITIDQLKKELDSFNEVKCKIEFYKELIFTLETQFIECSRENKRLKVNKDE